METFTTKTGKILKTEVQLLIEEDYETMMDTAFASQNLNPMLTYVRFILTDDKPNSNGERVPQDEFENLITTGMYMPLKMAEGEIEVGHDGAKPLGTIIHLRQEGDKIRGVAALWNRERPADVSYIKQRYADGKPLDLSWEIGYDPEQSYYEEESGAYCLRGCVLRATTLVGIPAYGGRTSITEVDSSTDESKEDENMEEKLNELEEKIETLTSENEELKTEIASLKENQMTDEVKAELNSLREFKAEAEAEATLIENLEKIEGRFKEAGLEMDNEYFKENQEKLLGLLESEMLDFFVDGLASRKPQEKEEDEEDNETFSSTVPNFKGKQTHEDLENLTPSELARKLREADNTK